MATRIGGQRRKTRAAMTKSHRRKGKISTARFMQTFEMGNKVHLSVEPAVQKGMYYSRYIGKTGIVSGKRGNCYEIAIKDGNKQKMLIVHPIHLKSM